MTATVRKPYAATFTAAHMNTMLRDSPTYVAFRDYHGRWITQDKATKIVRSLMQVGIDDAREQVSDWVETAEVYVRRDGYVYMASLFLAMGY